MEKSALGSVPEKLSKIEAGKCTEMSGLLPEHMGFSLGTTMDDGQKTGKHKGCTIANMMEWLWCFGIYMAVITRKQPECIPDLLGYQNLIIKAHMQFEGDTWMGYNKCFRQNAATEAPTTWTRHSLELGLLQ